MYRGVVILLSLTVLCTSSHPLVIGKLHSSSNGPPLDYENAAAAQDSFETGLSSNPAFFHGYYGSSLPNTRENLQDFVSAVKSNIRREFSNLLAMEEAWSNFKHPRTLETEKRRFLPAQLVG